MFMLSIPPLSGVGHGIDMDIEFDFCKDGSSNVAGPTIIVYMDHALWKFLMMKKDLNPESLRWYLLLREFDFEVRDKG